MTTLLVVACSKRNEAPGLTISVDDSSQSASALIAPLSSRFSLDTAIMDRLDDLGAINIEQAPTALENFGCVGVMLAYESLENKGSCEDSYGDEFPVSFTSRLVGYGDNNRSRGDPQVSVAGVQAEERMAVMLIGYSVPEGAQCPAAVGPNFSPLERGFSNPYILAFEEFVSGVDGNLVLTPNFADTTITPFITSCDEKIMDLSPAVASSNGICSADESEVDHKVYGTGAPADPHILCTAYQLESLATTSTPTDFALHYELGQDIEMYDYYYTDGQPEFMIGQCDGACDGAGADFFFTGVFDGAGHEIIDFELTQGSISNGFGAYGLFPVIAGGAEIRDLELTDFSILLDDESNVGGLAGKVFIDSQVTVSNVEVAGLSTIILSKDSTNISNAGMVIGLVSPGPNSLVMSEVEVGRNASIAIDGNGQASGIGGLIGKVTGMSLATAELTEVIFNGIVDTEDSNNTSERIGGLVGSADGVARLSINKGGVGEHSEIEGGSASYVGGLVGILGVDSEITQAYSKAEITGASYIGGVVGRNFGSIEDAYYAQDEHDALSSNGIGSEYIGGFVGYNQGTIKRAYVAAGVRSSGNGSSGGYPLGGFVGEDSNGTIESAFVGSVPGIGVLPDIASRDDHDGARVDPRMGQFDGSMIGGTYSNLFYSSNLVCNNNSDGMNLCASDLGADGTHADSHFYNKNNAPFYLGTGDPANWDSTTVWRFNGSSFPTLRFE